MPQTYLKRLERKKKQSTVAVDPANGRFIVTLYGQAQPCGFEYAHYKATMLTQWLAEQGQAFYDAPRREGMGEVSAWRYMMQLTIEATEWHEASGAICTAMLRPELIGLEGKKLWGKDSAGIEHTFFLCRKGGVMPVHFMGNAPGAKNGQRIDEAFVEFMRVAGSGPLMQGKVQHVRPKKKYTWGAN